MNCLDGIAISGIPFVPGCVQGKVSRNLSAYCADDILVVEQQDLGRLNGHLPRAILIVDAALFSHPVIHLMHLNIPVVIVSRAEAGKLMDNDYVHVNGFTGEILNNDTGVRMPCQVPGNPLGHDKVLSADGKGVYLHCSVNHAKAAIDAVKFGASAIGLLRSEMVFPPDDRIPDMDFYKQAFTEICQAAHPLPVTIRLLDIAPDKQPSWLPKGTGRQSLLGLQGIRLYESDLIKPVMHAQLLAIKQVYKDFPLRLLVPYVTSFSEFVSVRKTIRQMVEPGIPVGAMAETPVALFDISYWLKQIDFIAIGTNDLMQCLFAADRDLPELRRYLNPYAPVLFRLLHRAAQEAGKGIANIQVCGMLSQLNGILPVLLGLGYKVFSVEPNKVPYLAQTIENTNISEAQTLAEHVCAAMDSRSVAKLLGVNLPTVWE